MPRTVTFTTPTHPGQNQWTFNYSAETLLTGPVVAIYSPDMLWIGPVWGICNLEMTCPTWIGPDLDNDSLKMPWTGPVCYIYVLGTPWKGPVLNMSRPGQSKLWTDMFLTCPGTLQSWYALDRF